MATLQELEQAFIKADDAGNTEDAQAFATEIKKLRGNTLASTEPIKPAVQQPDLRQKDAQGRVLVPNVPEPTFAENAASGIAKFMGMPEGFNDETVDNYNDLAAGATSMNRGIGNLLGGNFKPKPSPTGNPVDKSSMPYLAGSMLDPTATAIGGGLTKVPGLGITAIEGANKGIKLGKNILAGSGVGSILGGLSEDGTAEAGGTVGGIVGGVFPLASATTNAGVNYGKHLFQNSDVASGRFANKAAEAGGKRDEILEALMNSNQYGGTANAGQAAAKAGGTEFAALQEIANARKPTVANTLLQRQEQQRASALGGIGRDEPTLAAAVAERSARSKPLYDAVKGSKAVVDTKPIADIMDNVLAENSNQTAITAPLQALRKKLATSTTPQQLQSLSKEISDLTKTTVDGKPTYDVKVLTSLKDALDDQIGAAEPAYAAARSTFKNLSAPVNRMNVGSYLGKELKTPLESGERAASFVKAIENAPKTIKKSTGLERFSNLNQVLDKTEMSAVDRVAKELINDAQYKDLAKKGMSAAGDIVGTLSKPQQIPNPLVAPITYANSAIRALKGKITDKTLDALALNMQNPQKMAELMQKASVSERALIGDTLMKYGIIGSINATNTQGEQ